MNGCTEIMTIEEFAKRMQIGRSTAYNWVMEGRLLPGVHLLRIGRIVRILWSDDLITHLLMLSTSTSDREEIPPLRRTGTGGRNRIALNNSLVEND